MKDRRADMSTRTDRLKRSRILIVDDQQALLESLQALLRINGFNVETAVGGAEAIKKLKEGNFSLILLDLKMSGIDGYEVHRFIRKKNINVEVIIVSGESTFGPVKEALRNGAYDFIRKPYVPEELLATVNNGLEHYWQARQLRRSEYSLKESERMYRFIVNNSPDFIYMLDPQGLFTYANDTVEHLLGYKRGELIGQHFSALIHSHNAEEIHNYFSEQRAGDRAIKNVEMRLQVNKKCGQVKSLGNHEIVVELNAIGMYEADDDDNRIYVGTLGCARDITARKQSEEQISYQAYHDLLTSLPNRVLFDDRVDQAFAHARRHKQMFALLFLDLDRFKVINDTLGHAKGDRVLQLVSERILCCLRAEDTLCRFGGDEFSLLLPNIETRENVTAVAEKILRAVREPYIVDEHELYLSVSIGAALFPLAGETRETLLQSADIAMYHVKASGKDGFCFYSDAMNSIDSSFLTVERDMCLALENSQFEVFFQPKVDPVSHMIIGMEALLRWQHPDRGLVYPGDFISIAEESRLIVPIGEWVLRATCKEISRWREQGLPKIKVSINISVVQLEQEEFVTNFIEILQEYKLAADAIEVEVSEQGLAKSREGAIRRLRMLSDYGVSIAIDDFGCGYTSLTYLRNYPISTLKIDRFFVRELEEKQNESCIVDAIVHMARGLNLHIVAEGVENLHQLDYLNKLGCREVQGHLYGAALPATETLTLLRSCPEDGPHFILPD